MSTIVTFSPVPSSVTLTETYRRLSFGNSWSLGKTLISRNLARVFPLFSCWGGGGGSEVLVTCFYILVKYNRNVFSDKSKRLTSALYECGKKCTPESGSHTPSCISTLPCSGRLNTYLARVKKTGVTQSKN